MDIGQKLRSVREKAGLTQSMLSKTSGVSERTIKSYEKNNANVTISIIEKLAKALNVETKYFTNDDVQQYVHHSSSNMSTNVHKLSSTHQVVNDLQQDDEDDNMIVHIPRFTDKASAGYGITNYHSENSLLSFTKRELRMHFAIHSIAHLSIMESIGDSMCPTIAEGSLLLIQEDCTDVLEGCIYVVRLGNDLYVKRVQKRPKIKLISDNTKYDPIELAESDELVIVGRVVGAVAIKRF